MKKKKLKKILSALFPEAAVFKYNIDFIKKQLKDFLEDEV